MLRQMFGQQRHHCLVILLECLCLGSLLGLQEMFDQWKHHCLVILLGSLFKFSLSPTSEFLFPINSFLSTEPFLQLLQHRERDNTSFIPNSSSEHFSRSKSDLFSLLFDLFKHRVSKGLFFLCQKNGALQVCLVSIVAGMSMNDGTTMWKTLF